MKTINRKIVLEKGGKLFLHYDEYDEEDYTDSVEKKIKEIEDIVPPYYLHELDFEIGSGVVMEDVFLFLKKDLPYWEIILGNCVSEYVKQSFEEAPKETDEKGEEDLSIERIFLSWVMEANKMEGKKYVGHPFPTLNGEGKSDGITCNIGFGGSHISLLNKVPIEIRDNLIVYYNNFDRKFLLKGKINPDDFLNSLNHRTIMERIFPFWHRWKYEIECKISRRQYNFGELRMSFFQFLYGIFYEFSFYGLPADRKDFFDDLSERVKDIGKENIDGIQAKENI